jgi:hypothetical protein
LSYGHLSAKNRRMPRLVEPRGQVLCTSRILAALGPITTALGKSGMSAGGTRLSLFQEAATR